MTNAIQAAAETYAELHGAMTARQVLDAIQAGDETVLRSVLLLMEVAA